MSKFFKNIQYLFLLFLLISGNISFSQEKENANKKLIFVDMDRVRNLSLIERRFVRKSAFEVIFDTKTFELTLSKEQLNSQKNLDVYIVYLIIEKNPSTKRYDLEFSLNNYSSDDVINLVSKVGINKEKVQYETYNLLMKLFYGHNYNEDEQRLIDDLMIPLDQGSFMSTERKRNRLLKSKKKKSDTSKIDGADGVTFVTDEELAKIKRQEELLLEQQSKKKREVKIGSFSSPDLDLEKKKENYIDETDISLRWLSKYRVSLGLEYETVTSESIVVVENVINRVVANINSNIKLETWIQFFSINAMASKVLGENPYNFSPRFNIAWHYNFFVYEQSLLMGLGLEYETLSFVNVAEKGAGLKGWNLNSIWASFKLETYIPFMSNRMSTYFNFDKSFIGFTDFAAVDGKLPLDGTKLNFGARIPVYKDFLLGFDFSILGFRSSAVSNFENSHQIFTVRLIYN